MKQAEQNRQLAESELAKLKIELPLLEGQEAEADAAVKAAKQSVWDEEHGAITKDGNGSTRSIDSSLQGLPDGEGVTRSSSSQTNGAANSTSLPVDSLKGGKKVSEYARWMER